MLIVLSNLSNVVDDVVRAGLSAASTMSLSN